MASVMLLLLLLALVPPCACCVFCMNRNKNIFGRFKKLCENYKKDFGMQHCSKYSTAVVFAGLGLDAADMDVVTGKTHRVFRVIEINKKLQDFRPYWDWLLGVKLNEYARNVLCPPTCRTEGSAINCTTCKKQSMKCWSMTKCYPEELDLVQLIMVLAGSSAFSILVGFVVCFFEYRRLKVMDVYTETSSPSDKEDSEDSSE